jgi:hypothetical protein
MDWTSRHQEAVRDARHICRLDSWGQAMIVIIVALAGIAVVWVGAGTNEAWSELLVRAGATAAILLIFPVVYLWQLLRAGPWVQKQRRMLTVAAGVVIVLAGLGVIALGLTSKAAPVAGNTLQQNIDSLLAKRGKTANNYIPGGPVSMGDASDGRGPFITHWDVSLDPWPTTDDGITPHQLRIFPKKRPIFTTQQAREEFRTEVGQLSQLVNEKIGGMIARSERIAGQRPMAAHGRGRGPVEVLEKLQEIRDMREEVESRLFAGAHFPYFKDRPLYREELIDILPDSYQPPWDGYNLALHNLTRAITILKEAAQPSQIELATANIGPFQDAFVQATSNLRDWVTAFNRRVDFTVRAI